MKRQDRTKAKPSTTRQAVASIKALTDRLAKVSSKLEAAGDEPISADAAKELDSIGAAIRELAEPTPPPAKPAEKRDDTWPRDMAAEAKNELTWGYDPEVIRG